MELEGDMLDHLEFRPTPEGIKIGVFGSDAPKADGHNKLSGKTNHTPQRRFIPDAGQKYKGEIENEIVKIIADAQAKDVDFKREDFKDVSSKADLSNVFKALFPDLTRNEVIGIIGRNDDFRSFLERLNLLRFL